MTAQGDRIRYRYGTARRAELEIEAAPGSGTLFRREALYTGAYRHLRFVNGDYSYIVYALDGNSMTGARAISGVVVTRGERRLRELQCRSARWFDWGPYQGLAERLAVDDESQTAM